MRGWEEEGQGLMVGMEVDEELMEGRLGVLRFIGLQRV